MGSKSLSRDEEKREVRVYSSFFLVRMTGFPPVAALADKQSTGLFGACECYALAHKLLTQFSPYFKSHHPYKQKGHNRKGRALFVGAGDGI